MILLFALLLKLGITFALDIVYSDRTQNLTNPCILSEVKLNIAELEIRCQAQANSLEEIIKALQTKTHLLHNRKCMLLM